MENPRVPHTGGLNHLKTKSRGDPLALDLQLVQKVWLKFKIARIQASLGLRNFTWHGFPQLQCANNVNNLEQCHSLLYGAINKIRDAVFANFLSLSTPLRQCTCDS